MASVGAACVFVVSEWLFFVTKPSMFSAVAWIDRLGVLLSACAAASLGVAATGVALASAARPLGQRSAVIAGALPAAFVGAIVAFLLVENFTKTVLGFNIGDVISPLRYVYLAGLVAVAVLFARRLIRALEADAWFAERRLFASLTIFALLALAAAAVRYQAEPHSAAGVSRAHLDRFNVVLLSSDGIDADRMSVYGYERETTPYLASRRDELLIGKNHIANSLSTSGSNGALLSGKSPTTTGVVRQLDVFRGEHVYQHLPGVLRQLGYHAIQVGARQYCDAYGQNMRQAFHVANERILHGARARALARYARSFPSESHFLGLSYERVDLRVRHALGLLDLHDVVAPVPFEQPSWRSDGGRIESVLGELDRSPRPFFAHVHLLDTHGPSFRPALRHFSVGRNQTEPFERDFMDDAILGFDGYVREVFAYLEARNELERTLVVISSDHGAYWSIESRVPLLVRFPHAARAGTLGVETQTLDVAPTVLDALGVPKPDWMEGESIVGPRIAPHRPFLVSGKTADAIYMTQCQHWFGIDLVTGGFFRGTIRGHTSPCREPDLSSSDEARERMLSAIEGSRFYRQPLFIGRRLTALTQGSNPQQRAALVEDILSGRVPVFELAENITVVRVHWDFWSRGVQPAGIVVRNPTSAPVTQRLIVRSGDRRREHPLRFYLEDGSGTREFVFRTPGRIPIELGPVPARSELLFIVWAERGWSPGKRALGVKLELPGS